MEYIYNFTNKVYVTNPMKKFVVPFAIVVGVIFAIAVFFDVIIDGESFFKTVSRFSFLIICIGVLFALTQQEKLVNTQATLQFYSDRMVLVNHEIDKKDGKGVRREEIHYIYENINGLTFLNTKNLLQVQGHRTITSDYRKTNTRQVIDSRENGSVVLEVIYIPEDLKNIVINNLNNFAGQVVVMQN